MFFLQVFISTLRYYSSLTLWLSLLMVAVPGLVVSIALYTRFKDPSLVYINVFLFGKMATVLLLFLIAYPGVRDTHTHIDTAQKNINI